jgi:predicted CXXCH cytochrome family protein
MKRPLHPHARAASVFAMIVLILIACAPESRYKALSFFFDGVPGGQEERVKTAEPHADLSRFHPTAAPFKPIPTPLPIVSVHKPVAEHRCAECHDKGRGYEVITISQSLCDKCHKEQRLKEKWDHGPINLGECLPCHVAHESAYPHLLDRPVPDVCLICHQEDMNRKERYHDVFNVNECAKCHNPHRN